MTDLIWVHDEMLRADHPAFQSSSAKAVFIWDNALMDKMQMGFKQRVFIYEALCELPVEIFKGDTAKTLKTLAEGGSITTAETPNPYFLSVMATLSTSHQVNRIPDEVFAYLNGQADLRRFFRYWNKAKTSALQMHGGTPDLFGKS